MSDSVTRIAENLARVRERIAVAAERAGRAANEVTLVGVTKYVGVAETRALVEAGLCDLGESRPQALWDKVAQVGADEVTWHLVGHLQRNKARRTLPLVGLIHSVDSVRLLRAIDREASSLFEAESCASGGAVDGGAKGDRRGAEREESTPLRRVGVLLEVNVSGDAEKHGWAPDELRQAAPTLAEYPHVEPRGLMTMASREGGSAVARKNFAELRALRDELRSVCPPGVELRELSMGMSGDFEAAIAEGATIVRVGSALFT